MPTGITVSLNAANEVRAKVPGLPIAGCFQLRMVRLAPNGTPITSTLVIGRPERQESVFLAGEWLGCRTTQQGASLIVKNAANQDDPGTIMQPGVWRWEIRNLGTSCGGPPYRSLGFLQSCDAACETIFSPTCTGPVACGTFAVTCAGLLPQMLGKLYPHDRCTECCY